MINYFMFASFVKSGANNIISVSIININNGRQKNKAR